MASAWWPSISMTRQPKARARAAAEVAGEQDCHEIGGREGGGGMPRAGVGDEADGVDAQLRGEAAGGGEIEHDPT
jgi:hypothetical protein